MTWHRPSKVSAIIGLGMFALAACATERWTSEQRATIQETSIQQTATQTTPTSANPLECPPELRSRLEPFCEFHNAGKGEDETVDTVILINIEQTPLAVCGCPEVSVCPPDDDCPVLKGRAFVGHRVFFGATVEGSCCEDICTATNGGTASELRRCVRACKREDLCG